MNPHVNSGVPNELQTVKQLIFFLNCQQVSFVQLEFKMG